MISRNEMVAEVLALYDALDEGKADGSPAYKAKFYEEGRKAVYRDALCMPFIHRDMHGEIEGYDEWLKHELGHIPGYMSRDEFEAEYSSELHALYAELKAKRIAEDDAC